MRVIATCLAFSFQVILHFANLACFGIRTVGQTVERVFRISCEGLIGNKQVPGYGSPLAGHWTANKGSFYQA